MGARRHLGPCSTPRRFSRHALRLAAASVSSPRCRGSQQEKQLNPGDGCKLDRLRIDLESDRAERRNPTFDRGSRLCNTGARRSDLPSQGLPGAVLVILSEDRGRPVASVEQPFPSTAVSPEHLDENHRCLDLDWQIEWPEEPDRNATADLRGLEDTMPLESPDRAPGQRTAVSQERDLPPPALTTTPVDRTRIGVIVR